MATLEFPWPKRDLRPNHETWTEMQSICIGTENHQSLSRALRLTSLPSQLRARCPSLKIYIYRRGMNPIVFKGNPYIHGVRHLPREIFGEAVLEGALEETLPQPELYVSPSERDKIREFLSRKTLPANHGKPLCILHAWKQNGFNSRDLDYWDSVVSRWNHHFRFWQVGLENDSAIQGCEYYFLPKRTFSNARRLFALISQAQAFIGTNSSPLLISRAFRIPSLDPFRVSTDPGMKRVDEFFEPILKLKSGF